MGHNITRRKFLITTATGAAAVVAWNPLFPSVAAAAIADSQRLSLDGGWQVSEAGKGDWTAAMVPGCVHTDLLAAGRIPDPFYRDNEKAVQWISDSDWLYRRTFDVPAALLKNERVRLRCEGFDTIAVIKINGVETCRADNMFRRWEVDVKSLLHAGKNAIEVFFKSPNAYIKEHEGDDPPQKWIRGRAWLRKEQCSYGWDWGPVLASSGIWKSIGL